MDPGLGMSKDDVFSWTTTASLDGYEACWSDRTWPCWLKIFVFIQICSEGIKPVELNFILPTFKTTNLSLSHMPTLFVSVKNGVHI